MKCPVCFATGPDNEGCSHCGYDITAPGASDMTQVLVAREKFKQRVTRYAPDGRVSRWDRWRPWAAVALAFFIFIFWLRACSSGGRLW